MAPSTKRKSDYVSDEFVTSDGDTSRPTKRNKAPNSSFQPASEIQTDNEGNKYWEISKTRRITISDFKGKSLVNIREYYQKDGDWLPGKKGISLTVEQYAALVEVIPQIESQLKQKGEDVPRPNYNGGVSNGANVSNDSDEEVGQVDVSKSNIEATSDEEE